MTGLAYRSIASCGRIDPLPEPRSRARGGPSTSIDLRAQTEVAAGSAMNAVAVLSRPAIEKSDSGSLGGPQAGAGPSDARFFPEIRVPKPCKRRSGRCRTSPHQRPPATSSAPVVITDTDPIATAPVVEEPVRGAGQPLGACAKISAARKAAGCGGAFSSGSIYYRKGAFRDVSGRFGRTPGSAETTGKPWVSRVLGGRQEIAL